MATTTSHAQLTATLDGPSTRRGWPRGLVFGLVLSAAGASACSGRGPTSAPPRLPEAIDFDVRTETFVDTSRETPGRPGEPATPSRALETQVYLPRGPSAGAGAARPLIVFVHGSGGNPEFYRVLLDEWARRGYVVAAPRLPGDLASQPRDVSFVISELLRLSTVTSGPYAGVVDANRIGVAGHSAGAVTTLRVGFNSCCVDPRVRAGAVLAGDAPAYAGGTYFTGIHTPLLVVHAMADPTVPFAEGRRIFTDALPPKMMLTVPASDTPSADHARPYVGTENRALPDTRIVMATTTAFFDRYLRDDRESLGRARKAVEAEVSFRLEVVES